MRTSELHPHFVVVFCGNFPSLNKQTHLGIVNYSYDASIVKGKVTCGNY
jgi:hypothetical protein